MFKTINGKVVDKKNFFKFFVLMFVFVVAAIAFKSQALTIEDEFLFKNIEALASDENDDSAGRGIKCYSVIKNEDEGPYSVTRCSTCMDVKCTDYSESSRCNK